MINLVRKEVPTPSRPRGHLLRREIQSPVRKKRTQIHSLPKAELLVQELKNPLQLNCCPHRKPLGLPCAPPS